MPPRLCERGHSDWALSVEEGATGLARFDHAVNGASHLCSDGNVCFSAQIRVVRVLSDVSMKFVAKTVGPLLGRLLP